MIEMVLECRSFNPDTGTNCQGMIRESGSNFLSQKWYYDYDCPNCGGRFMLDYELKRNLRKMNGEWIMTEEKTILVSSAKAKARFFQATSEKWVRECRSEKKPVCQSCMKLDYDKGQMGKREDYMKNITQVGSKEITNSNTHSASYGKKIGDMVDYVCPKGHKISIEFGLQEIKSV